MLTINVSVLGIAGVINEAHEEVAHLVEEEEGPVALGHRFRVVEVVVHEVHPHETEVVKQVHWDVVPVFEQVLEVLGADFR